MTTVHSNERPFQCEIDNCNQNFKTKDDLVQHQKRVHTNERPFQCEFSGCSANFKTKGDLKDHMKSHSDERPYHCSFPNCDRAFKKKSKLDRHLQYHSDERNFKCSIDNCNQDFKTKDDLSQHQKQVHTNERPFQCEFSGCSARFKTKGDLKAHLFSHSNERPFSCTHSNCAASFKYKNHLVRHLDTIHTIEGQQRQKKSETSTFNALIPHFPNLVREHHITFSCMNGTFCRIDYLYIGNGILFLIENDEHQHEHYPISCEIRRMIDAKASLMQEGNDLPVVFIRYNPDAFTIDDTKPKINKSDRIRQLVRLIKEIESSPKDQRLPLSIYYLYYNLINEQPSIFYDKDYPNDLKSNAKWISN